MSTYTGVKNTAFGQCTMNTPSNMQTTIPVNYFRVTLAHDESYSTSAATNLIMVLKQKRDMYKYKYTNTITQTMTINKYKTPALCSRGVDWC